MLLTDIVMPHMWGAVLAERFLKMRPDSIILFKSGYT
jgi:YesN/AraC family two-component response regulator